MNLENYQNYAKLQGMRLARKLLPSLCPFSHIDIIDSLSTWEQIRPNYGEFVYSRIDAPVGKTRPNVNTSGRADDIPKLIRAACTTYTQGIVLVSHNRLESVERYENNGAFNILFNVGQDITMELVGQGFDGHVLTRGISVHERYRYQWDAFQTAQDITAWKTRAMSSFTIPQKDYTVSRALRIEDMAQSCNFERQVLEAAIPATYTHITNSAIERLVENIILSLCLRTSTLFRMDLKNFAVQGNIVKGKPQVWEIYRPL